MRLLITTIMLMAITVFAGDWGLSDDYGYDSPDVDYGYEGVTLQDYGYHGEMGKVEAGYKENMGLVVNYGMKDKPGMTVVYGYNEDVGLHKKYAYIPDKNIKKQIAIKDKIRENLPPLEDLDKDTLERIGVWKERLSKDKLMQSGSGLKRVEWDVPENLHAVAEASTPVNWVALTWFKEQGYNAVFLTWEGQSVKKLYKSCERLNERGWTVILTYGVWNKKKIWVHPNKFKKAVRQTKDYVDAVLPMWRGSSGTHWKGQAEDYAREMAKMVRSEAPDMPIIGEAFWTFSEDGSTLTGCEYASAVHILNAGKRGVIPEVVIERTKEKIGRNVPVLYNIVGPAEHYTAKFYKPEEARQAKNRIRERALNGGAAGTITFFGDAWQDPGLQVIDKEKQEE